MAMIEDTSQAKLQATSEGVQRLLTMTYSVTVHWGLYALIGRGEWAMHQEQIPIGEYEKLVDQFNPVNFSASDWVALVADAGAEALLITSKHHDGFCMFDSQLTDYKITSAPFGRDPIGELAEACHARGIALHFYYSLLDWHHPAYRANWPAYRQYYQGQVRELCTRYGELGGVLFDGYWPRFEAAPETEYFLAGGAWDLAGTYDLIHTLQPQAMVVNNHHVLPLQGEDYQVFELDMPGENTVGFNTTDVGALPLVTWFNVNQGWSYFKEQKVKPAEELISFLARSTERNAKCFLNVGPTPAGEILAEECAELRKVGEWLHENRQSAERR